LSIALTSSVLSVCHLPRHVRNTRSVAWRSLAGCRLSARCGFKARPRPFSHGFIELPRIPR
jgi:hypothetical protein